MSSTRWSQWTSLQVGFFTHKVWVPLRGSQHHPLNKGPDDMEPDIPQDCGMHKVEDSDTAQLNQKISKKSS